MSTIKRINLGSQGLEVLLIGLSCMEKAGKNEKDYNSMFHLYIKSHDPNAYKMAYAIIFRQTHIFKLLIYLTRITYYAYDEKRFLVQGILYNNNNGTVEPNKHCQCPGFWGNRPAM